MNRTELINYIIKKFNYTTYLEIGLDSGTNFNNVFCEQKSSVDPNINGIPPTYNMTSDEFFKQNVFKFDIIFIDGLHEHETVDRDIENSLKCLNENGMVILHDCNPARELLQRVPRASGEWTGDVWKSIVKFRMKNNTEYGCCVMDFDYGCGMIGSHIKFKPFPLDNVDFCWDWFNNNRIDALNLISESDLESSFK